MSDMFFKQTVMTIVLGVLLLFYSVGYAENIDPNDDDSQYAYGENVGWFNAEPGGDGGDGVEVDDTELSGYIWAENIGWINLSPTYGGVTNDGDGNLGGYAWGENVGWVNFNPTNGGVTIDGNGNFDGWAWGENIGWIHFQNPSIPYKVQTAWAPTVSTTSTSGSSTTTTTKPNTTTTTTKPSTTTTVLSTTSSIPQPPLCLSVITPESTEVVSGQALSFTIAKDDEDNWETCEEPDYEWSVQSTIGSSCNQSGNYTAGINFDFFNKATDVVRVDDKANGVTVEARVLVSLCALVQIYGENSEEIELLRTFRDNILSQTPEGQEIIRLYYEWSPAIVAIMEKDEEFKEYVKEMIDGVLELMEGVE